MCLTNGKMYMESMLFQIDLNLNYVIEKFSWNTFVFQLKVCELYWIFINCIRIKVFFFPPFTFKNRFLFHFYFYWNDKLCRSCIMNAKSNELWMAPSVDILANEKKRKKKKKISSCVHFILDNNNCK